MNFPIPKSFAKQYAKVWRRLSDVEYAGSFEPPRKVEINYVKKSTGELVTREIRPYEIKPHRTAGTLMVYATDTLHGASTIHSFIAGNVRKVSEPLGRFRPIWDVKLGMD